MIKVSAQTFFTASRMKSEINIRIPDLCDNLHSFLRFYKNNYTAGRYRNKYCLNLKKKINCISLPYHSSLSYIKGRSDFQTRGLKREM